MKKRIGYWKGKTFSPGHRAKIGAAHKGKKLSQEHIEVLRKANLGRKNSIEAKQRMSKIQKSRIPSDAMEMIWERKKGKPRSEECKNKISESLKGNIPWNKNKTGGKGYPHTEETKKILSECKMGDKNPMYGRMREKSPRWMGGITRYASGWNKGLKAKIRKRDDNKCQICGEWQEDKDITFNVHHINYNREDLDELNLITLCKSCHGKTNSNREDWERHLSVFLILSNNLIINNNKL